MYGLAHFSHSCNFVKRIPIRYVYDFLLYCLPSFSYLLVLAGTNINGTYFVHRRPRRSREREARQEGQGWQEAEVNVELYRGDGAVVGVVSFCR